MLVSPLQMQFKNQRADRVAETIRSIAASIGNPNHDKDCQSLRDSDFDIVMKEFDLRVCSNLLQFGVNGTLDVLGCTGWMVWYFIDEYTVRVHTDVCYPANHTWIYATSEEIAKNILSYLGERTDG